MLIGAAKSGHCPQAAMGPFSAVMKPASRALPSWLLHKGAFILPILTSR